MTNKKLDEKELKKLGDNLLSVKKQEDIKYRYKGSTGPKTQEGKFKVLVSKPHTYNRLLISKGSKLMREMRKCNNCPLRAKNETRMVQNKEIKVALPAKCPGYEKDKELCILPVAEFLAKVKIYYEIIKAQDNIELQKSLIMQSMIDAQMNREYEILTDGRPKFYTKEYQEQALKYVNELNKMIIGEKHRHEVKGEMSQVQKLELNLSEEQLDKLANTLIDANYKPKIIETKHNIAAENNSENP